MTYESVEPRPWPLRRWTGTLLLIFVSQLGLIFWLGTRTPAPPRPTAPAVTLYPAAPTLADLRALYDPSLFALPHANGFSGPVCQSMPRPEFRPFEWSAPKNHLPPAVDRVGAVFPRLVETNYSLVPQFQPRPEAQPMLSCHPPPSWFNDRSLVELEGDLAERNLMMPLQLKSWSSSDILTNSVVQVIVDAEGRPVSATVLSGSGSAEADQYALDQAEAARFTPVSHVPGDANSNPSSHLCWGKMIFIWHTVPTAPPSALVGSP